MAGIMGMFREIQKISGIIQDLFSLIRLSSTARGQSANWGNANFVTKVDKYCVGNRSRWINRGYFGSSASVHPVWMGYSIGHCRRPAWEVCVQRRCWNLCPWHPASLLYRALRGLNLLRGQYQTPLPERTSSGVRIVFWRSRAGSNEPGRSAALCAAFQRPVPTKGFDSGSGSAHGRDWIANRLQREAFCGARVDSGGRLTANHQTGTATFSMISFST